MNKKVIVIGAGGHAKVIGEIIESNNDTLIGFLDDKQEGKNIIGKISDISKLHEEDKEIEFIIAIGNNEIRNKIYADNPKLNYYKAIHPSAIISKSATIGEGTAIMANVVLNTNSSIGNNCIINTSSVVEHDCIVEDGAHISYCVTLGAGSKIGKEAYIDIGAIIARGAIVNPYQKIDIREIIKK